MAKFGFKYLKSREEEWWILQRRKISKRINETVQQILLEGIIHCSAVSYKEFSKSLCKK